MLLKPKQSDFNLKLFLLILLIADICYSFLQNYHSMWLDGDMSSIIMPSEAYKKVMNDPFAFRALLHHETYAAPNRFFIHWFMQLYFKNIPFLFQNFFDPVQSIYISVAAVRTGIQVALIYLLSLYASGSASLMNKKFLTAAVIITPFFQVNGFEEQMGVTFNSITYSFFYSLPLVFILLYFLPFYFSFILKGNINFNWLRHLSLIVLTFIICLGGPLGAPVMLICCSLSLFYLFLENIKRTSKVPFMTSTWNSVKSINGNVLFHFLFAIFLALYSIYIGTFNTENEWAQLTLLERYLLLPKGLWKILAFKLGSGFLLILSIVYFFILSSKSKEEYKNILLFIKWLIAFCILYTLMLPLGGYRVYRPLIIRADTFTPVTISIFFAYVTTALILINQFTGRKKSFIVFAYVVIAGMYMNADRFPNANNDCQVESLRVIERSDKQIVELTDWCDVMSWVSLKDYHESDLNAQLIQYWGITKEKKYYFHR